MVRDVHEAFEKAEEQKRDYEECLSYYEDMTDEELRVEVQTLVRSEGYKEDKFSGMVANIISQPFMSPKQKRVLVHHLTIHREEG